MLCSFSKKIVASIGVINFHCLVSTVLNTIMGSDYRWDRWDISHPINGVGVTSMGPRICGIRKQELY